MLDGILISDYVLPADTARSEPYWHCRAPNGLPAHWRSSEYHAALFVLDDGVVEARYAYARDRQHLTAMHPRILMPYEVDRLLEELCTPD